MGGQAAGMGFTSVGFANDWSAVNNQAGLAFLDQTTVGVYAENRFLLSELSLFSAQAAVPTRSGTFGLGLSYFGDELYNETFLRLGYGRMLIEDLSFGVELDYVGIGAGQFGSLGAFTFGLGILYNINEDFSIGAHYFNPLNVSLTAEEGDILFSNLRIGASYRPSEKLLFTLEGEKPIVDPLIGKVGLQYLLTDAFTARIGYASNPDLITGGVGFEFSNLFIDLAASIHPDLGLSPHLSIHYKI